MIDYFLFGVVYVGCSCIFYDSMFGVFGYKCLYSDDNVIGYGMIEFELWLQYVVCLVVVDFDLGLYLLFKVVLLVEVDVFYCVVFEYGGKDNGGFGKCEYYGLGYYVVFVVDFDGYWFEVYCELDNVV